MALQKAKKGLITQREAAAEIGQSERHVRRLLKKLKRKGDAAVAHGLRGRRSNRKIDEKVKQAAIKVLRGWMTEGKLWQPKRQRIEKIHSGGSGGSGGLGWASWCSG